jgi:hypothetical protein
MCQFTERPHISLILPSRLQEVIQRERKTLKLSEVSSQIEIIIKKSFFFEAVSLSLCCGVECIGIGYS